MNKDILIAITIQLILPIALILGLYIQVHGEISPGGGFQTGAILATCYIFYYNFFSQNDKIILFQIKYLKSLSVTGVLIYALTGLVSLFTQTNYLNYYSIANGNIIGQTIGIMLVELGVAVTVTSVFILIFLMFERHK